MSALPCPVVDPFAVANQAYATICTFLRSAEAGQVKHSDLERQLEGMGRELMRKLLQAHLDLRQPGKASDPVRDAEGTTLTPTPEHTRSLESIFAVTWKLLDVIVCVRKEADRLSHQTYPTRQSGEVTYCSGPWDNVSRTLRSGIGTVRRRCIC